ncbi:MAG: hypothetical protein WC025_01470 [Candidatus Magasanikbacteria bacterium]
MKTKKILFVLSGFFVAVSALVFFVPNFVQADSNYGLDDTATAAKLPMTKDLASVLGNVIGSALSLISVLFFGLMLYGGIIWMTARGKSESTSKALDTIIAATIGIIIVLAAYAITNFVFSNVISGGGGGSANQAPPTVAKKGDSCATSDTCSTGGLVCGKADDGVSKICGEKKKLGEECNNFVCIDTLKCVKDSATSSFFHCSACGNGVKDLGEACDGSDPNNTNECNNSCQIVVPDSSADNGSAA